MNFYLLLFKSISLMFGLSAIISTYLFYFQFKKPTAFFFASFLLAINTLVFTDFINFLSTDFPEMWYSTFRLIYNIVTTPALFVFCYFGLQFIFSLFGKKVNLKLQIMMIVYFVISETITWTTDWGHPYNIIPLIITTFYMILYIVLNFKDIVDKTLKKALIILTIITAIFTPTMFVYFSENFIFLADYTINTYYFTLSILSILFGVFFFQKKPFLQNGKPTENFINEYKITAREVDIIELMITGKNSKDIAENLYISPRTVTTHISNIYSKTEVKSRVQLMNLFGSNWSK